MAWLETPPTRLELLAFGYVRKQKKEHNIKQTIADDITLLIHALYPKDCVFYGIGANNYNELGTKGNVSEFQQLFPNVSIQPQDIFTGYCRILVKTKQDRLYSIGNNYNGCGGCGKVGAEDLILTELREINTQLLKKEENRHFVSCCSSGFAHVLFVYNDRIYAFGNNSQGQCGNNSMQTLYSPTPIDDKVYVGKERIIQIECGYEHTILLNANGQMFACGNNADHQCGIEILKEVKVFSTMHFIPCATKIKRISVGGYHNLCISVDDDLYIFGRNINSELGVYGLDSSVYYTVPTINPYFKDKNVAFVSTKLLHSFVLDNNGICYLFGSNASYQISKRPKNSIKDVVIFQKEYSDFAHYKFKSGSCGSDHTLLIAEKDNKVIGFGGNQYQQTSPFNQKYTRHPHIFTHMEIGIEFEDRIVRAIAGEYTTVLVKGDIQKKI